MYKITLALILTSLLSGCADNNTGTIDSASSGIVEPLGVETFTINGETVEAASNEVILFLSEDITTEELDNLKAAIAAQGAELAAFDEDLRLMQIRVSDDLSEIALIAALENESGVAGADVNRAVDPEKIFITDNQTGYQRYLDSYPATKFTSRTVPTPTAFSFSGDFWANHVSAEPAWTALSTETLAANTIAIVDTGLPAGQNSLDESRLTRIDGSGTVLSGDDTSSQSHGLFVSSMAAAYNDDEGMIRRGINPHSNLIMVDVYRSRFFGLFTYTTDLVNGIRTAIDQGAQVVNVSWGDRSKCDGSQATRLASRKNWRLAKSSAVNYARANDALVVWSAGSNCEKNDDQLLPSADDTQKDSWISHSLIVAASTSGYRDACFSRTGSVVNLAAPGQSVGYGDGTGSGTSYAAPLVTGAAGLIRSINSTLSAPETRSILLNSVSNSLTLNSTAENQTACAYKGDAIPGETDWSASSPNGLLNLSTAVQTGLLTQGVDLTSLSEVPLGLGQTEGVNIEVNVPSSGVNALDLVFLIDQSGSFGDDIDTLQAQAAAIITDLNGRGFDIQYGVTGFSDFPIDPFGHASYNDIAFKLYQTLTNDQEAVTTAIGQLDQPLLNGRDLPESQYEGLFQVATGQGRDINGNSDFGDTGDITPQSVGFRDGALRIVVFATDAIFHDSDTDSSYPGAGRTAVLQALQDNNLIVFGLRSGDFSDDTQLQEVASETNGQVFELSADSSGIAQAISDAVTSATSKIDVTLEVLAQENFITNIQPPVHENVSPGSTVAFTVTLEGQRKSSINDLTYDAYLWARGDGSALLKRVRVPIRVPQAE